MTKSRITHHNTNEQKTSKKQIRWIDKFASPILMKEVAVSTSTLERLAEDIVQWALKDPDALYVTEYFVSKGITSDTWSDWRKKCPELERAYTLAKELIGVRQFKGVTKGKLRETLIKTHIGHYSEEWREEQKRQRELAAQTESRLPLVVLPDYGTSDVVPELEIEKDKKEKK